MERHPLLEAAKGGAVIQVDEFHRIVIRPLKGNVSWV
jgi:hypothetical protein